MEKETIITKFKIAGGNPTAFIKGPSTLKNKSFITKLLQEVEQVGFISGDKTPSLEMMGGELCINATLAFASTLGLSGEFKTSGVSTGVKFENIGRLTTIFLDLPYQIKDNIVLFEGIGFILYPKSDKVSFNKDYLGKLCNKYNLKAFGGILYKSNKIEVYTYVKAVDSFVKETACGSGSIAFSLISGKTKVKQPSGGNIKVEQANDNSFKISARVKRIS